MADLTPEKPEFLYHSNTAPDYIEELRPLRPHKDMAGNDVNAIFASAGSVAEPLAYLYALKDAGNKKHPGGHCRSVGDWDGVAVGVFNDRQSFLENAGIGRVYSLPSDSFENVSKDGKPTTEWTSKTPVKTDRANTIEVYNMKLPMTKGAQIFFLDEKISDGEWQEMQNEALEGLTDPSGETKALRELMKSLIDQGLATHENREQGINPMNLETGQIEPQDMAAKLGDIDLTGISDGVDSKGPQSSEYLENHTDWRGRDAARKTAAIINPKGHGGI